MANPTDSHRTVRLRQAVTSARAPVDGALEAKAEARPGAARRTVRFPNANSALRTHVAQVQAEAAPRPQVPLRLSAASPSPAAQRPADELTAPPVPEGAMAIAVPADLGRLVRAARVQRHLSQGALAALAGTGRRFIGELEAGKTTLELGRVLAVCRVLGVRLFVAPS